MISPADSTPKVYDILSITSDINGRVLEIESTITGSDEQDAIESAENCITNTMLALSKANDTFEMTRTFIEESITFYHKVKDSKGF